MNGLYDTFCPPKWKSAPVKFEFASCSAWSMPHSADVNESEMPGNPPHDAVFVSKSRNGLFHC